MACYSATVANQFYDQYKGCRLDCRDSVSVDQSGAPTPHSHWWNASKVEAVQPRGGGGGGVSGGGGMGPDFCEDPSFVPPEPLGHMAWTNEPVGTCK